METENQHMHVLRIVSYNVHDITVEKLSPFVQSISNVDVACITRITSSILQELNKMLPGFVSFQVFIEEGDSIGTVIYCNKKTVFISEEEPPYYFDYDNCDGRIIGTGIKHRKTKLSFNVLTAELDFTNDNIRKRQLETVQKVIANMDNYILLGDLAHIPFPLNDIWIKLGCPGRVKYNYNGEEQQRLTRVYYTGKHLTAKALTLIGSLSTQTHCGVEACFQLKKGGGALPLTP